MAPARAPYSAASFLLTPLREGRPARQLYRKDSKQFLLTPLREGRPTARQLYRKDSKQFLLTPLQEGRPGRPAVRAAGIHFYSRPCERGDRGARQRRHGRSISTHAPARGATSRRRSRWTLTAYFYSRPCERGDGTKAAPPHTIKTFLLTPLREGRPRQARRAARRIHISTHAPARGATRKLVDVRGVDLDFYSRPCERGDQRRANSTARTPSYFYSRPCERGDQLRRGDGRNRAISTHAPARGATKLAAR